MDFVQSAEVISHNVFRVEGTRTDLSFSYDFGLLDLYRFWLGSKLRRFFD